VVDAVEAQCLTIIGAPKVGKSTFASQFPNALFAATEPGLNFLEVFQTPVENWDKFKLLCRELYKDPKQIETLVIDTVDILYIQCNYHHCSENGIKHPSDLNYGKGFSMVNNDFRRVLSLLTTLRTSQGKPMGLVFITHAKEVEVDTRVGKNTQWRSTLPQSAANIVLGMSEMILFLDVEDGERIIRTDKSERWTAGDRTGRLPAKLPLNYQALETALGGTK
tara:strand:- start:1558 stop:2223 length:666 start_codon:yes stop_codon:yes gene_type:complete